ncbi:hypothetical protein BCR33DRAFT_761820 [Rhizoclosmatium globosum]|uniref:Choline/ethanolaminephosphotransferase n=1 Tax=Rhizoclosmatium globosum TaxID=329046 RepID=A0A1Y2CXT8_9FUNG|nr:hypothetical protein HDU79_002493 [Rhizoclosmatium sp. JEL0117]ORY51787.1 hypothetical protein BCR33DRAFT_761820 [Rhizoclosmatium globosum]|eukprot:ORY51787.1 hypothetical protein BCR33DRAFT_761820 [Rhizoclosmatium globosum]
MYYFRKGDVERLKTYSYKSIDKSFVANKILNPYWWSVIIDFVPSWVAPNLITLTGFLCVIVNVLLLFYLSPDLKEPCPWWAYISFAAGLFIYQSLDAIDGKQARRTGTSGPLGELFDHGCDALNTGFATFLGVHAMGLSQTWFQLAALYSCLANFYLSTWEEYYTGILYLSECSGPIEGVLSMCGVLITTAFYGPSVWKTTLGSVLPENLVELIKEYPFLVQLSISELLVAVGLLIVVANVIGSVFNVQQAIATNPASAAKAQKCHPVISLLPFPFLALITALYPYYFPNVIVTTRAIIPFVITVSFLMGQQVGSIIVAHISKRVYPLWEMVAPGVGICGAGILVSVGSAVWTAANSPSKVWWEEFELTEEIMWGIAAGAGIMYLVWFVLIVVDLCEVFDIYCLTIKHPKKAQETKSVEVTAKEEVSTPKVKRSSSKGKGSAKAKKVETDDGEAEFVPQRRTTRGRK